MISFPDFYEGGCVDVEELIRDLFTVPANKAADGLSGIEVVPWLPLSDAMEETLRAKNGYLRAQRVGGTFDLDTRQFTDRTRVSICAVTPTRALSWQVIEYVRQVMTAYREGGHVHRSHPIDGSSTTFMTVPGEVVGPQLIPEQIRDERLVPVLFEIHTDRPRGLPDYRESLGLDD